MLLAATLLITADDDFKFGRKHFSNIYVKKEKYSQNFHASTQFKRGEINNHLAKQKTKNKKKHTAT